MLDLSTEAKRLGDLATAWLEGYKAQRGLDDAVPRNPYLVKLQEVVDLMDSQRIERFDVPEIVVPSPKTLNDEINMMEFANNLLAGPHCRPNPDDERPGTEST